MVATDDSAALSPAILVPGLGHLSIPLLPEQTQKLQKICSEEKAPLDNASESFADAERQVMWKLDSSKFSCSNPGQYFTAVTYLCSMQLRVCLYF